MPSARLCVINDTVNDFSGAVKWSVRDADGNVITSGEISALAPSMSSCYLDNINIGEIDPEKHHICYYFENDGAILSYGSTLFISPKEHKLVDPDQKGLYTVNKALSYLSRFAPKTKPARRRMANENRALFDIFSKYSLAEKQAIARNNKMRHKKQ